MLGIDIILYNIDDRDERCFSFLGYLFITKISECSETAYAFLCCCCFATSPWLKNKNLIFRQTMRKKMSALSGIALCVISMHLPLLTDLESLPEPLDLVYIVIAVLEQTQLI